MNLESAFASSIEKGNVIRYLYRYRPFNSFTLDALKNHYLWFSKWEDYNDPFDGKVSFRDSYSYDEIFKFLCDTNAKHNFERNPQEINAKAWELATGQADVNKLIHIQVQTMSALVRTCSFSKVNDNILMWSHYTGSHMGICLEFDCLEDPMTFFSPIPIEYCEDYNEYNYFGETQQMIKGLISHKYKDWSYEQEHRVFKYPEQRNKINYRPEALKSVIFGCRADANLICEVKDALIGCSHITYKKCCLDSRSYKLNITEL